MEVIVVAFLMLIVGGGLLTTFLTGQTSYLSADAYIQVQQEARRAFDVVVRELREAQVGPATVAGVALQQLNFQIARGYNTDAGPPPTGCTQPASICWGNDTATGGWVHYAVLGDGTAADPRRLIRYQTGVGTEIAGAPGGACTPPTCRVLSNYVDTGAQFTWDSVNRVVTITLRNRYNHPALPGGNQQTPLLTSRVKLRN